MRTQPVVIMNKCFFILICYLISINALEPEIFDLGPFQLNGFIGAPLELEKNNPLEGNDLITSRRIYKVANDLLSIVQELDLFDPFKSPDFNISTNLDYIIVNIESPVTIRNLIITGLKNLEIEDLEVRKTSLDSDNDNFRFDLHVTAPLITAAFDFTVKSKILFLHVTISGSVKISLQDIITKLALQILERRNGDFELVLETKAAEIDFNAKDLQVQMDYKTIGVKHMITKAMVENFVERVVKPHILQTVGDEFIKVMNQNLNLLPGLQIRSVLHGVPGHN